MSQSGTVRRATRAQILAGTQPQIAVAQGELLGRVSLGTGAPEPVALGANLTLAGGVLSAPAPYSAAALPLGRPAGGADLIPLAQGGRDAALPYAQFMAGIGVLSGFDLSEHRAAGERVGCGVRRPPAAAYGGADPRVAQDDGAVQGRVDDGLDERGGAHSGILPGWRRRRP